MKVSLFTDGISPYVIGGMQKHSFYLTKYFALNKIFVDLYHCADNRNEAEELNCFTVEEKKYINSFFISFDKINNLPGHYLKESYLYSVNIYRAFNKNQLPDFIYIQGLTGTKLLEEKHQINVPVGVNFHGLEMFQKAPNISARIQQYLFKKSVLFCLKKSDVVFSLGGNLTSILISKGISKNKIVQMPIGIDESWVSKSTAIKKGVKRSFIFIGRYERRKGIEELSKALFLLNEFEYEFNFIGNIPESKKINLPQIKYWGSISDSEKLKSILSQTDVLVCPSYSEGMPTVILEAMASGLAILASDVGAVCEQVDKTNGILISPGNISELNEGIKQFIRMDDDELVSMKQISIQKVKEKFLWSKIISKTIFEIQNILK